MITCLRAIRDYRRRSRGPLVVSQSGFFSEPEALMHSSSLPNMVRVPGKDSLPPWPQTNTPLRVVRAVSNKSESWQAGFPQTSYSSTLTSLSVSRLCCLSNAWPDSHMNAGTLTFCSVMPACAFKWQSTGILFFFLSFADIFATNRSCCGVFFPLYFPEITWHSNHVSLTLILRSSVDEIWVSVEFFWVISDVGDRFPL